MAERVRADRHGQLIVGPNKPCDSGMIDYQRKQQEQIMTDKIEMKPITDQWHNECFVCGEYKEIACVGYDQSIADNDNSVHICEQCLKWADIDQTPQPRPFIEVDRKNSKELIDWKLEGRARTLEKFAAYLRSLKGRLELPSYAEWEAGEVAVTKRQKAEAARAEQDAEIALWLKNNPREADDPSKTGRLALQRLRERRGA